MRARWVLASAWLAAASLTAGAAEPQYPHGAFTGDCTTCHDAEHWKPAKIDKSFRHPTRFPLRGAHATAPCRDCHMDLDFTKVPKACADCHQDPHLGELGTDCARCHTERNFLDRSSQLELHRVTRFPLTGAHAAEDCEACHKPQPQGALKWVNTPIDCEACHLPRYQATTNPNHVQAGFPTDCAQCHRPTAWEQSRFDHNATPFPLTGAHRTVACQACHGNFQAPPPTACYGCHKADYDGTTDPNHAGAGFPTDCTQCHNTTSWQGATFNHSTTPFPLTGAHTTVACQSCHGNFQTPPPTTCYGCHKADYDGTTDPNHAGAGFPTDCTQCHNTTSWQGATFTQHDTLYFPIYSGHHVGRWSSCTDCHTTPTNYAVFSCFKCHDKTSTDSHHTGVSGYAYDSNACYSCHPRGSAG